MDKILIEILPNKTVNGKPRSYCLIECPDCKKRREVRLDMFRSSETSCCRSCINLRRPTKSEEELFDWEAHYHSKEGKLAHAYQQQKQRCVKKGWPAPTYNQEELVTWGMSNPQYHALFEAWENSGFRKELSPSIDRLDDYTSYTLDNIQITSWKDNNHKGRYWQVIGENTKNSLAVDQLDMSGVFINRFHSIKAAARALSIDDSKIGNVCKGVPVKKGRGFSTPVSAGGFKWRYSTQPNPITQ